MPDRLSALDLRKKNSHAHGENDADEVRAFLDRLAVEQLTIEKREAEDQLITASERLEHYVSLEETIEKTLAAQQTVVKMEDQARKEAELIIREARQGRDRKTNEARLELERLQADIARARSEFWPRRKDAYRSTIVGFEAFMQALEQEALPSVAAANDAAGDKRCDAPPN